MKQSIVHVALVVKDYDEAIAFYTEKLHFTLVEDTEQPEQNKRWSVVSSPNSNEKQQAFIGWQSGGRVFLFLQTDAFERDVRDTYEKGIEFVRELQTQLTGVC